MPWWDGGDIPDPLRGRTRHILQHGSRPSETTGAESTVRGAEAGSEASIQRSFARGPLGQHRSKRAQDQPNGQATESVFRYENLRLVWQPQQRRLPKSRGFQVSNAG